MLMTEVGTLLSRDCDHLSDWMSANSFKLNADFMAIGTSARLKNLADYLIVVMDEIRLEESKEKREK